MTATLQLTDQQNPLAQTFRVLEPGGSVITSVGVFFHTAPTINDPQSSIFLELRPVAEGGFPSGTRFFSQTRTSATAANIRAVANTEFSSATEYKFTFRSPIYFPENTEVAIVMYSAASAGAYRVWGGTLGDFVYGSTAERITHQLDAGALFQSSNGTAWNADQTTDLAFKVYRAVFQNENSYARIEANPPGKKRLTENPYTNKITDYPSNPLVFTGGSNVLSVIHPAHGFNVGDKVVLSDLDNDSADIINGVSVASYVGTRTITARDAFGYSFNMDESADSSVRGGGNGLLASEQYGIDNFSFNFSPSTPIATSTFVEGFLTTTTSLSGTETAYQPTDNVPITPNSFLKLNEPHVITSVEQEQLRLSGNASMAFNVWLSTDNKYSAPSFKVDDISLVTATRMLDDVDSAGALSTINYVAETAANGGTTASKHITVPFILEDAATSIRVLVDASRPEGSEFTVWYRTNHTSEGTLISDKDWTAFSKSISSPNTSNYSQIGYSAPFTDIKEYEFNAFDITSFDEYQIKITMNSRSQVKPPVFSGLRTIATA